MYNIYKKASPFILAFIFWVLAMFYMLYKGPFDTPTMSYGVFLHNMENVYSIEVHESSNYLLATLKGTLDYEDDEKIQYKVTCYDFDYIKDNAQKYGVKIIDVEEENGFLSWFLSARLLHVILGIILLVIIEVILECVNQKKKKVVMATSGSKGGASYTEEIQDNDVKFSDVAGLDEEIVELKEIVDFLKFPDRYTKLGAMIPKGVLLHGKPGTGKTLLARAVAGEAGVSFITASGSEFINKYVGVGADNIRKLFKNAQNNAPCIIFIDEIDAIGGNREDDDNSERKQAIDELLTQLDGFKKRNDIIILAATNNFESLDPALKRKGRFDRIIPIGLPDVRGREKILKIHARNKPLMDDVSLEEVAKRTAGFSGADLENLLNEAAIHAARKQQEVITNADLEEAFRKVTIGLTKTSRTMTEKEKKLTANHEAGHAIVSLFTNTQARVKEISIVPHGTSGGYTMNDLAEDKNYIGKEELVERLTVLMAGRAAEQIFIGETSTGASQDIKVATRIARDMISVYGMGISIGPVSVKDADNGELQLLSDNKLNEAGDEIIELIKASEKHATEIIDQNRKLHQKLVQMLLEQETVTGDELLELYNKHNLADNAK